MHVCSLFCIQYEQFLPILLVHCSTFTIWFTLYEHPDLTVILSYPNLNIANYNCNWKRSVASLVFVFRWSVWFLDLISTSIMPRSWKPCRTFELRVVSLCRPTPTLEACTEPTACCRVTLLSLITAFTYLFCLMDDVLALWELELCTSINLLYIELG